MSISRTVVHRAGGAVDEAELQSLASESIGDVIQGNDRILWLDIQDPTPKDLEFLRGDFGFHELTLQDVARGRQRPKIEHYGDYTFVIFFALRRGRSDEIAIFIGANYLVTAHRGKVPEIEDTVERWRQNTGRMEHGVALPVYSLLDGLVDGYFPIIDEIAERVEVLENRMFAPRGGNHVPEVLALKRDLLHLRRTLAPEREVLNVLIRREQPLLGEDTLLYFQDIYDHIIRVLDAVDLYRDQLTSLLEAHLSVVSNRLNFVMKRMTSLATILMSVNLVASNYGMNFARMPELQWEYGYFFTLGLMVTVGLVLFLIFKRLDWL